MISGESIYSAGIIARSNGWMDQDATWYTEVGLGPGDIVLDGDPAPLTERGTAAASFRPMSIAAKRSTISATAELLLLLRVLRNRIQSSVFSL